jgi:Ca2+-binding RTX toxin-like protein
MAVIRGKFFNDNLKGTSASDTLQGFGGDDTLFGGFSGEDLLDGGPGNDTASYLELTKFNGPVNASLETNKATFLGSSGTFISIENLIGSNDRDTLTGNAENNRIEGHFGSDDISGRAGNDTLIGGAGLDTLKGELGDDSLLGDGDADLLEGGDGKDFLAGGTGFDILKGELGDDRLFGGDDADLLEGGDGGDFLGGGKGNDTILGGSGNDEFQWMDDGRDLIGGGDGSDLIQGGDGTDNLFFFGSTARSDKIELTQSGSDVVLRRTNLIPVTLTTQGIESFQAINTGNGDDILTLSNLPVTSGVKFIQFMAGEGNDRLDADSNVSPNITAIGGNGNDSLTGGNGNDKLFGGEENDVIFGGNGNDLIQGAGISNLGRSEIDALTGGAGQDTFVLDNFYNDGNLILDREIEFFNGFNSIDGMADFARITDFKVGEDLIQLSGLRDSYELKPITNSLQGGSADRDMGIFKKGLVLEPLELIAIVQDAPSDLNINDSAQFKFI